MTEKTKREIGTEMFKRCYGSSLMEPPAEGQDPFFDIMLENLFGSVWAREEQLSMRDRRLFTLGIIAAMGEADVFAIQCGCALRNDELDDGRPQINKAYFRCYLGFKIFRANW